MSIKIGNYNFEGPFASVDELKKQSGVYVVLGRNASTDRWNVVDVGESENVHDRMDNHDRSDCWRRQGYASIMVAVYYCNEQQRMRIEQELREQFNPPCGKR